LIVGDALRLYLRYIGVSVRSQMQYQASFWMFSAANLLGTGIEFIGIWALFDRFDQVRGWTLPEVALFYGVANVAFAIAESVGRGFDTFPALVRTGDFDTLLLRPRSTALQVAGLEFQMLRVGRFLQGLAVLLWAIAAVQISWTAAKVALIVAMIFGGALLFYGLFILQATLSFWTIETLEMMNSVTYGGNETAKYPLTIYRPWFRRFFTFVIPLACMNYLPASVLLERPDAPPVPAILLWAAPAIGGVFLVFALQFWHVGVRHYHSTGS
jgi:ABC-2 type transport system permease protein